MTKYFIKLDQTDYVTKNKLQGAWKTFCKKHDRRLFQSKDALDEFMDKAEKHLQNIQEENKRCRALDLSMKLSSENYYFNHFGVFGVGIFSIYEVNEFDYKTT